MKSIYGDRDTIGTQLLNTQEAHMKSTPIEVGDLGKEMGKTIMKGVLDSVELHSGKVNKFYIEAFVQKDHIFKDRKLNLTVKAHEYLPLMQPNQDIWFVDYVNQVFEHLWGLPSRSEFELVLSDPSKDNEKNLEWINAYLKLERNSKKNKVNILKP